jgi:hypothetical protein
LYEDDSPIKVDNYLSLKKQGSNKIVEMWAGEEGYFIAYENEVQFFPTDSSRNTTIDFEKPARSYQSKGAYVRLFDFTNNIWLTLKEGVFYIFEKKYCIFEK